MRQIIEKVVVDGFLIAMGIAIGCSFPIVQAKVKPEPVDEAYVQQILWLARKDIKELRQFCENGFDNEHIGISKLAEKQKDAEFANGVLFKGLLNANLRILELELAVQKLEAKKK